MSGCASHSRPNTAITASSSSGTRIAASYAGATVTAGTGTATLAAGTGVSLVPNFVVTRATGTVGRDARQAEQYRQVKAHAR